jgi:hypothetical protein
MRFWRRSLETIAGKGHALVAGLDGRPHRVSKSTIGRIWKKFDLKPHLQASFKPGIDELGQAGVQQPVADAGRGTGRYAARCRWTR